MKYKVEYATIPSEDLGFSEAYSQLLVGGNHLASALIGWLGADESKFPPFTAPIEAGDCIMDVGVRDAWICWRAIMRFRTAWQFIDNRQ